MNIALLAKLDWEQKWFAPDFSFVSCSYFGEQYYRACRERWDKGLPHVVFIARGQGIVCYQSTAENAVFGSSIARRIARRHGFAAELSREVVARTDELYRLMKRPLKEFYVQSDLRSLSGCTPITWHRLLRSTVQPTTSPRKQRSTG